MLDLDVRPGKDGVAELENLAFAAGQRVPDTVTVISGSGAKHLYFRIPLGLDELQKPKGTRAIDFLRSRQGVVVPGSMHESGNFYKFVPGLSPNDIDLAEIPEWLLGLMRSPTGAPKQIGAAANANIGSLFAELLASGPPSDSMAPGRFRPDDVVRTKMKTVPMRLYPDDRSHSDSHWAWTLARNCCHHWDQYLRLWEASKIRTLPESKCGRPGYEASILLKAFSTQKQQWKSRMGKRPVETSANPELAAKIRQLEKDSAQRREYPRSKITLAVIQLHRMQPDLKDKEIADALNETGQFNRLITRNNVKRIRHSYPQRW